MKSKITTLLTKIISDIDDKRKLLNSRYQYTTELQNATFNQMIDKETLKKHMDKYCDLEVLSREYLNKISRLEALQNEAVELYTGTNLGMCFYRLKTVDKIVDTIKVKSSNQKLLQGNWAT